MFYAILGIGNKATTEEIKKAYRRRAAETHPDSVKDKEEEFKQVQLAYEVLSDEIKRAKYDRGEHWEDTSNKLVENATGLILNYLRPLILQGHSLRVSLKETTSVLSNNRGICNRNLDKLTHTLKRIQIEITKLETKIKKGEYLASIILDSLKSEEANLNGVIAKTVEEEKTFEKALEMLDSDSVLKDIFQSKSEFSNTSISKLNFNSIGWSTHA